MKMNFSRAVTIIKSSCPSKWARAHAKALATTRERHGIRGVYVQMVMLVDALGEWRDQYGACDFLKGWVEKHREDAEHPV